MVIINKPIIVETPKETSKNGLEKFGNGLLRGSTAGIKGEKTEGWQGTVGDVTGSLAGSMAIGAASSVVGTMQKGGAKSKIAAGLTTAAFSAYSGIRAFNEAPDEATLQQKLIAAGTEAGLTAGSLWVGGKLGQGKLWKTVGLNAGLDGTSNVLSTELSNRIYGRETTTNERLMSFGLGAVMSGGFTYAGQKMTKSSQSSHSNSTSPNTGKSPKNNVGWEKIMGNLSFEGGSRVEYDPRTKNKRREITVDFDRKWAVVCEYDPETGLIVRRIERPSNADNISAGYLVEYKDGKKWKETSYHENGNAVKVIEYNPLTGDKLSTTRYNPNGSESKKIEHTQAISPNEETVNVSQSVSRRQTLTQSPLEKTAVSYSSQSVPIKMERFHRKLLTPMQVKTAQGDMEWRSTGYDKEISNPNVPHAIQEMVKKDGMRINDSYPPGKDDFSIIVKEVKSKENNEWYSVMAIANGLRDDSNRPLVGYQYYYLTGKDRGHEMLAWARDQISNNAPIGMNLADQATEAAKKAVQNPIKANVKPLNTMDRNPDDNYYRVPMASNTMEAAEKHYQAARHVTDPNEALSFGYNIPRDALEKPDSFTYITYFDPELAKNPPVVPPSKPVTPPETKPVTPPETKPVTPPETKPVTPPETKPVTPPEPEVVTPRESEPVPPRESEPVPPRESKPVTQPQPEMKKPVQKALPTHSTVDTQLETHRNTTQGRWEQKPTTPFRLIDQVSGDVRTAQQVLKEHGQTRNKLPLGEGIKADIEVTRKMLNSWGEGLTAWTQRKPSPRPQKPQIDVTAQKKAELKAQQKADELKAQQKADELKAKQEADRIKAQQKADELQAQQKADEL